MAKKAGLESDISGYKPTNQSQKKVYLDFHKLLTASYQAELMSESDAATIARKYLKQRHVDAKSIQLFKIGYSPNSYDFAIKKAKEIPLTEAQLVTSGAIIKNEKEHLYDRFRGRLMFPIFNIAGSTIAFSARSLSSDNQAKYINSSESPIFQKKATFYGLHLARAAIKEHKYVIIVEGQLDVILCHQYNLKHVIASSGTAFTEYHLAQLKKITNQIVFAFDADNAGVNATKKSNRDQSSSRISSKICISAKR